MTRQLAYLASTVWLAFIAVLSISVTDAHAQASRITAFAGGGQSAGINTAFGNDLVAKVADASGNPVQGVTVNFAVPGSGASAILSASSAVTNVNGEAWVSVAANSVPGAYSVTAVTGSLPAVSFNLVNFGSAANLSIQSGDGQRAGINTAFALPLVARITDAGGNPVAGETITFTAPGSGASAVLSSPSAITDINGEASVTATANGTPGTYNVTATSGALTAIDFALTNESATAAVIQVLGNGQIIPSNNTPTLADGTDFGSQTTGTGTPRLFLINNLGSSEALNLTVDSIAGANPGDFTAILSDPSAAAGEGVALTVTFTPSAVGPRSASITLTTNDPTHPTYVINVQGEGVAPPAAIPTRIVTQSGSGQSAPISTPFTNPLVVFVGDDAGAPVAGVTVNFAVPASGAGATLSSLSAVTDVNGLASITATANATSGSYTVSATVDGLAPVSFALTNYGAGANLAIVSGNNQRSGLTLEYFFPLVAKVTDAGGNPVAGQTVNFALPVSGASAVLSAPSAVTDSNGEVSVVATADLTAGAFVITATTGALAPVTFSLENIALFTNAILVEGNGFEVFSGNTPNTQDGTDLGGVEGGQSTNQVLNIFNLGFNASMSVSVASVTGTNAGDFTAQLSGSNVFAGGIPRTPVGLTITFTPTGAGLREAIVTLNTNDPNFPTYTLNVQGTGLSDPPATGVPHSIAIISGSGQSTEINTNFTLPLVVQVTDFNGGPVDGVTVNFGVPSTGAGATLSASSGITDELGHVSVTATANGIAGSYTASASVASLGSVQFALVNNPEPEPPPPVPRPVANIMVTAGGGQSAPLNANFAPIVVTATDAVGVPVPGVLIIAQSPASGASANLNGGTNATAGTTNANGQFVISATANATAGAYTVDITNTSGLLATTASLTNISDTVDAITVVSGSGQNAETGAAFASNLVARVTANGTPVGGVAVSFQVPGSGASATLVNPTDPETGLPTATDSNGEIAVGAIANLVTGTYNVSASTGAFSTNFSLTNSSKAAANLRATSGLGQFGKTTETFALPLVATVTDEDGNGVPGVTVNFTAPGSGASAMLSAPSAITDSNGKATVTATANATSGAYEVTATSGALGAVIFGLTNHGDAASITVTSGSGQSVLVNGAFADPLVAVVTDVAGTPVPGATVNFAVPASGASAMLSAPSAVTDTAGRVSVTATANSVAGTYNVDANTGSATGAAFALTNTPDAPTDFAATSGGGQNTEVTNAFTNPLIATVTDTHGNPVPGITVNFAAPSSGASATLSASSAVTDTNGEASVTATANATAGTYDVTAEFVGVVSGGVAPADLSPVTFTLTNNAGSAATIAVTSGNNQDTEIKTAFANPLVVTVSDTNGNPVSGITVGFSASANGASASLSAPSGVTDANGQVSITATANAIAGDHTVTASVASLGNAAFTLQNTVAGNLCDGVLAINQVQGERHVSPYKDQNVETCGVVTAVTSSGYYIQSPTPDQLFRTSEGLYVDDAGTTPRVGTLLKLSGTVIEFIPGGAATGNLSVTQLTSVTLEAGQEGQPVPAATLIGDGGYIPRTRIVISPSETDPAINLQDPVDAANTPFDPNTDGIDFYESMENMLVTVSKPSAISGIWQYDTNKAEVFVVTDRRRFVRPITSVNARRGLLLGPDPDNLGDQNPERIKIDFDELYGSATFPSIKIGDNLGNITGVLSYSFGNYGVRALGPFSHAPSPIAEETAVIRGNPQHRVRIASYNVMDLSAVASDDAQRAKIAAQIVNNLTATDIIALQEIQDNNGDNRDCAVATCTGELKADITLQKLVDAIVAAGGPTYSFVNVDPASANTTGGAADGNIRNAFLYNPARVGLVTFNALTQAQLAGFGVTNSAAFTGTPDPLLATFSFNGKNVTVINNHFTSRSGSTPVFGGPQPFVQAGEAAREAQALTMNEVVRNLLGQDPAANAIVLGTMNTFEWSNDLATILRIGAGPDVVMRNLISLQTQNTKYSKIVDGNAQALDHIFVTRRLFSRTSFRFVHVNADFPRLATSTVASDHDPILGQIALP